MIFECFDWLYLVGMLVVWYGNVSQIVKMVHSHSTKSFSFKWFYAILISFCFRAPRALTTEYWVWGVSYIISILIMTTLVSIAVYYKKEKL